MDQYGIKITPTNGINQICNLCKYKYANINVEPCSSCDKKSYYIPSDEGVRVPESDTQKELIDLRVELRVEKEKSKALEEYSRGLELKVKELENSFKQNIIDFVIWYREDNMSSYTPEHLAEWYLSIKNQK